MPGGSNFRVTTGGMSHATVSVQEPLFNYICPDKWEPLPNITITWIGLAFAEGYVPNTYLAAGAHAYGYDTDELDSQFHLLYWKNYYSSANGGSGPYGNEGWAGLCMDLGWMTYAWTTGFPNIPIAMTEDNWNDQPANPNNAQCPYTGDQTAINGCEGTYLVDLLTWMSDHNGYSYQPTSTLRIMWMPIVDFQQATPILSGIYETSSVSPGYHEKSITIPVCPANILQGTQNISWAFYNLDLGGYCY